MSLLPCCQSGRCAAAVLASRAAAARELEMAHAAEEGRQRAKAKPGSLVINPDGYTYCYAVKIEAVSEGSTSKHSRTGSQALEGDESRGPAQAASSSSDVCGVQQRRAEAGDAQGAGVGCLAQGSSSQRPQASDGGPLDTGKERDGPSQEPVTSKDRSGAASGGEPEQCVDSQPVEATHREASSSQGSYHTRTQRQNPQRPTLQE